MLQTQVKIDLTSIAISHGKCLLTDYILSLLQAVHRHGCNIKELQLAAYDRDCKRLNDKVLVALNYKSFRNLQVLDLSSNQLQCTANLHVFSALTKLTSLNLSANEIRGPAFQQLLKALPGSLVSLKLRAMPQFLFADMLSLSEFLAANRHGLQKLDISGNIQANSKGLLTILQACQLNGHLRKLKANDSSVLVEVVDSIRHLIASQGPSALQEIWLLKSGFYDKNRSSELMQKLQTDIEQGTGRLRRLLWSSDK